MSRIAIILSFLVACDVGSVLPANGGSGSGSGSGMPDEPDAGAVGSNGCKTAPTPAAHHIHQSPTNVTVNGVSNTGLDCLSAGCHNVGAVAPAPQFYFAGSLYTALTTTAAPLTGVLTTGAVVSVTDATGLVATANVDDGGNFYYEVPLTFPLSNVNVSACPKILGMAAQLTTGQGGCNDCHVNPPPAQGTSPVYLQ